MYKSSLFEVIVMSQLDWIQVFKAINILYEQKVKGVTYIDRLTRAFMCPAFESKTNLPKGTIKYIVSYRVVSTYPPTLQFLLALLTILVSFSSLFWCYRLQLHCLVDSQHSYQTFKGRPLSTTTWVDDKLGFQPKLVQILTKFKKNIKRNFE